MSKLNFGLLGFSDGNGHPYSFSAILNGYNEDKFSKTQWTVILKYLKKRSPSELCDLEAKISHIWCQERILAEEIAGCCNIDNVVDNYLDMIGNVHAVIIARDDYENHKVIAEPFLKAGIPVMIDKPLTLDRDELEWFMGYHDDGLVFSCSGMRFCQELDYIRDNKNNLGNIKLVKSSVINNWDKYGIHMLDATLGIWDEDIESVNCFTSCGIDTYTLTYTSGLVVQINTLGPNTFSFSYEAIGDNGHYHTQIRDNFTAFKRMLDKFIDQVKTGTPSLDAISIRRSINTLIAGHQAKIEQATIKVSR